jgi:hypothetical protein
MHKNGCSAFLYPQKYKKYFEKMMTVGAKGDKSQFETMVFGQ